MKARTVMLGIIAAGVALPAWAADLSGQVTLNGAPAADVVVYVEGVTGGPAQSANMTQQGMSFRPGVVAVRRGDAVTFPNQDAVFHSVYAKSGANPFDLGLYMKGPGKSVTFGKAGQDEVHCHIHKQMKAYVLTLDNGYFAKTDAHGRFTIKGVPAGSHKVTAWASPDKQQSKTAGGGTLSFAL